MTSSLITVQPGSPQLVGANPSGTPVLIVNRDAARGVWLGSDASVAPGHGLYVGPYGSATWTPAGVLGAVYACVDTGVTVPVELNYTTEAQSVTSPLTIVSSGTLTADITGQQIDAQITGGSVDITTGNVTVDGAVAINQSITQVVNSGTINYGATFTSPIFDCAQYQSLAVDFVWVQVGALIGDMFRVNVSWFTDAAGTALIDNDVMYFAIGQNTNAACHPSMRVPVRARYAFVSVVPATGNGTSCQVTAYGFTAGIPNMIIRSTSVAVASGNTLINPPLLLALSGLTVPPGSSVHYYMPPVRQRIRVNFDGSVAPAGTMIATIQGGLLDNTNHVQWFGLGSMSNQAGSGTQQTYPGTGIDVPAGVALMLTVTNNDTQNRNPNVEVWDTSDY